MQSQKVKASEEIISEKRPSVIVVSQCLSALLSPSHIKEQGQDRQSRGEEERKKNRDYLLAV